MKTIDVENFIIYTIIKGTVKNFQNFVFCNKFMSYAHENQLEVSENCFEISGKF